VGAATYALFFLAGLAWWSLLEYLLHRWVFHGFPRTLGERHLKHHAHLHVRRLAVAPLATSVTGALLHAAIFLGLFGPARGLALLAGLLTGYGAYEWVHWSTHYRVPKGAVMRALRRHHMIHHHAQQNARYGVTSPLWDWVFGTLPPAPGRGKAAAMRVGRQHLSP